MNKNTFSPYIRVAMHSTLTAPYKIDKRVIFDYELILVTDGKCEITIGEKNYLCCKNDVIFLRPGVSHRFKCVDNCNFVQPHIHFDILYSDKSEKRFVSFKPINAMTSDEIDLIQEDIFKNINIPDVFTPRNMADFKKLFFGIIEIFQKKSYNYELLYKAEMLKLIDLILTQFEPNKATTTEIILSPIMAIKGYIDNNFNSRITLDSLSKQFYMNKYTLIRNFRNIYSQSPMAYYRAKRIEYIKTALETTEISITSLSEKMNFTDIYSFSRFFKTYVGCSPSEYRKNLG